MTAIPFRWRRLMALITFPKVRRKKNKINIMTGLAWYTDHVKGCHWQHEANCNTEKSLLSKCSVRHGAFPYSITGDESDMRSRHRNRINKSWMWENNLMVWDTLTIEFLSSERTTADAGLSHFAKAEHCWNVAPRRPADFQRRVATVRASAEHKERSRVGSLLRDF